jgi:hypothetical protein
MTIFWDNLKTISPITYKCGYCNSDISSEKGYSGSNGNSGSAKLMAHIAICHKCKKPTFFDLNRNQTPGSKFGENVQHIPEESIVNLFQEAKDCYSINAFTACVMLSRKLLMNLSVSVGAKEGDNFASYVNYLNDNGYIPPNGKEWVDSIRKLGNSANHKIEFNSMEEAQRIIKFTEMLLRFIYEMPGILKETNKNEIKCP